MPLLTGTWKINVNGTEGDFIITSMNADGLISGTVIGVPFSGYWNESSQMIFFETNVPAVGGTGTLVTGNSRSQFKGYLFLTPPSASVGSDLKWTLAGSVTVPPTNALQFVAVNSHRITFGWFAQVTQIV